MTEEIKKDDQANDQSRTRDDEANKQATDRDSNADKLKEPAR